jgi:hypothetical protein
MTVGLGVGISTVGMPRLIEGGTYGNFVEKKRLRQP